MSPRAHKRARPETVALTRSDIDDMLYEMGWESEDADMLWSLAKRRQPDGIR